MGGFAAGCSLAWWGLWVEFLAVAYGLGVTGYILLGLLSDPRGMILKVNDAGGPAVLAPFFLGVLAGTVLTLLGRTRMMSVPPGSSGVKKVFFGAWAFTMLRLFATIAGAVLILMAASQWPDLKPAAGADMDTKGKKAFLYFVGAFAAFAVGVPFWVVADLTTIPGVAVVGGEIPSARVRRRASLVTFVLQFLLLAYVLVVAGGVLAGSRADFRPTPPAEVGATPTRWRRERLRP